MTFICLIQMIPIAPYLLTSAFLSLSLSLSLFPFIIYPGIYGVVVGALIATNLKTPPAYSLFHGFLHMGAGLSVGLSGLAAGFAIGVVGDAGVRGTAQQPRLFVGMVLILIFAEVLGLYGLIVSLILIGKASS